MMSAPSATAHVAGAGILPKAAPVQRYTLPELDYDVGALEPYISGKTMELHHGKHHAGYVENTNLTIALLEEARANFGGRRTTAVYDEGVVTPVGTVNSWVAPLTVPGGGSLDAWAISSVHQM